MNNEKSNIKKVLIVEDDLSVRAMFQLALKQAGYNVSAVSSGEEAVHMLQNQHFDRLLTDGKMKPMDGFQLSLKARALDPYLRIAMVSAVYMEKDIQGYPIEAVFTKPLSLDGVIAWIQS